MYGLKSPFLMVLTWFVETITVLANYFRFLENKLDTHNIRVIVSEDFITLLVSTGNEVCLRLIVIITLKLREIRAVLPRVFLTLASALILSAAVSYLTSKVALGQVFSENFGFPCHSTSHLLLHNHLHYHPRLAQ
jgi:hypothetical protein